MLLQRTRAALRSGLGAAGELELEERDPMYAGCHHHLGTTRMHADPRFGVVDAQCQVHGVRNLFVAGSSVFPTGGHANPTFTVVALALRLADEIRRNFGAHAA
jgi:choline dehydrogenase-like flavoprotein